MPYRRGRGEWELSLKLKSYFRNLVNIWVTHTHTPTHIPNAKYWCPEELFSVLLLSPWNIMERERGRGSERRKRERQ